MAVYEVELHAEGIVHARDDATEADLLRELVGMIARGLPVVIRVNGGTLDDGEKEPATPRLGKGEGYSTLSL